MVAFGVLPPEKAFDAINIESSFNLGFSFCVIIFASDPMRAFELAALSLLFGSMVMTIVLEREGLFALVIRFLTLRCDSARVLLVRSTLSISFWLLCWNSIFALFYTGSSLSGLCWPGGAGHQRHCLRVHHTRGWPPMS
jgi:hypothetical protein